MKNLKIYSTIIIVLLSLNGVTQAMNKNFTCKNKVMGVEFSKNNKYLFAKTQNDIEVYKTKNNKLIKVIPQMSRDSWIKTNPYYDEICALKSYHHSNNTSQCDVMIYNLKKKTQKYFDLGSSGTFDWLNNGSWLLSSTSNDCALNLYDLENDVPVTDKLTFNNKVIWVNIDRNENVMLIEVQNEGSYMYHLKNDTIEKISTGFGCYFNDKQTMFVIPDRQSLTLSVYNAEKGNKITELSTVDQLIKYIHFMDDHNILFTYDYTTYLKWDLTKNTIKPRFFENGTHRLLDYKKGVFTRNNQLLVNNKENNFQEFVLMENCHAWYNKSKTYLLVFCWNADTYVLFDGKTYKPLYSFTGYSGDFSDCGCYIHITKNQYEGMIYDIKKKKIILKFLCFNYDRRTEKNKIFFQTKKNEIVGYDYANKKKFTLDFCGKISNWLLSKNILSVICKKNISLVDLDTVRWLDYENEIEE